MISYSPEETGKLGERLAKDLRAGDVILLEGPLGAGKSELARGVARGLGVRETVTSPSFTILNAYTSGRLPLYHFDWYRVESVEELYELGLDEYLGGDGAALVEWPGKCPEALPADFLMLELEPMEGDTRRIRAVRHGGFRPLSGWEDGAFPDGETETDKQTGDEDSKKTAGDGDSVLPAGEEQMK